MGPRGFFLSNPLCFGVERGELEERLEAQFYQPKYLELEHKLRQQCLYPVQHLRDLAVQIVDGPFGSQLKVDEYVSTGVPLVRVSDVKTGELVDDGLVFITPGKQEQLKRSQVLPGDVILTKAGAILGYSAVFPDRWPEGNITSHSVSIRCKHIVRNRYLSFYLRSEFGNRQVYRWGSKSTRPELNTGEVGHILVVVPPLDVQDAIADKMDAAHQRKRELEAEAKALLESIDGYVLGELGIELPKLEEERHFTQWARTVQAGRLNPEYYHPEHMAAIAALSQSRHPLRPLKAAAQFHRKSLAARQEAPDAFYIGLKHIQSNTGELINDDLLHGQDIDSRASIFEVGDVLFPRLRPYLNKVHLAQFDGLCSTEFHVLRTRDDCHSAYLKEFLLTSVVVNQTKHMMTGNTLPRLQVSDIESLQIPLPPLQIQQEIAVEVQARREQARTLMEDADQVVAEAKVKAERMILGEGGVL